VVVAVLTVRMVEMAPDPVICVLSVWHGLVTAARTVRVLTVVRAARVRRGAVRRVGCVLGQQALDHMVTLHAVQVPVVKVVDMPLVRDRRMLATTGVRVGMRPVSLLRHRGHLPAHLGT